MQDLILEKKKKHFNKSTDNSNSLDYFDQNTSLFHFTNLKTQLCKF